jgi:hypothetical protein
MKGRPRTDSVTDDCLDRRGLWLPAEVGGDAADVGAQFGRFEGGWSGG